MSALRIQKILLDLLLENGACPTIKNNDGYTLRQLCHDEEILNYFLIKEAHISVSLTGQTHSKEEKKPRTNQKSFIDLQENIIELDREIETKVELEDVEKQVAIGLKSYRLSHEIEANIKRILRRKNKLRKKMNQKLPHSVNPKNKFLLETFFNTFLRCFR